MRSYIITGKLKTNGKKGKIVMDALDKQDVWNNPEDFGFTKVFSVDDNRGILRDDRRKRYE